MATLKFITVLMAVLIVGGTITLGVLIAKRMGAAPPSQAQTFGAQPSHAQTQLLLQPPGTRITGIAATATSIAITLQGGGPDRILLLNPQTLAPIAHAAITPAAIAQPTIIPKP